MLWHVDNLKISCKIKFEVTKLICYLQRIYEDEMTVHHGGKGKYLGMDLDFTEPGFFQVSMTRYIDKIFTGGYQEQPNSVLQQLIQGKRQG